MTSKRLLEIMADLESRIAVIYERFAAEFRGVADVSDLWDSMSREELHHADLLSRAAGAAGNVAPDAAMTGHVHALEQVVTQFEGDQRPIVSLQEALRLTADLEEAEAAHLHAALSTDERLRPLADDSAMQHRLRGVLEHAIRLFGTPALQQRLAWRRFHD